MRPISLHRRGLLQAGAAAGLGWLATGGAKAQIQAIEQVRILYGFPAGSSGDTVSRRIGEKIAGSGYTRNAAVVDNRPGAGGRIALELLKPAPADGSVLAVAPFSCTSIYPHIYSRLGYDPVRDFVAVSTGAIMLHGLAVGPVVPAEVRSVKDFLAWAKARPDLASYGSPAAGSTPHFIGALLGLEAGVDLKHVPYRGSVPGVSDVVAGQIAAMVTPHGDFLGNYRAGKLRILGVSGQSRSPFVPEVLTFAEQGFPTLVVEEWFGFYAPARTPAATVAAANAAINAALQQRDVIDSLAVVGLKAQGSTSADMARSQAAEMERWGPLVKKIGFTAES